MTACGGYERLQKLVGLVMGYRRQERNGSMDVLQIGWGICGLVAWVTGFRGKGGRVYCGRTTAAVGEGGVKGYGVHFETMEVFLLEA